MKHMKLWENFKNENETIEPIDNNGGYISHQHDPMLNHYLTTALWTEELETQYDVNDFSIESKEKARKDCNLFKEKAGTLLNGLDLSTVGHDFWLTRNNHGSGFWDGDYEESVGEKLTEISNSFNQVYIFKGDDNKIEIE